MIVLKRYNSDLWRISCFKGQAEFFGADKTPLKDIFVSHKMDVVTQMAMLYKQLSCIEYDAKFVFEYPGCQLEHSEMGDAVGLAQPGNFYTVKQK